MSDRKKEESSMLIPAIIIALLLGGLIYSIATHEDSHTHDNGEVHGKH